MSDQAKRRALLAWADALVALHCLDLALRLREVRGEPRRRGDWTALEDAVFVELAPHLTQQELGAVFGRSVGAIKSKRKSLRAPHQTEITQARAHRCASYGNSGLLKPGNIPHTWVPVGTEVVDVDGYRKRKVRDDLTPSRRCWEFVHRLLWIEHHGPIPRGMSVVFRNGDRADFRIENLELVDRAELMRRNTLHRYPKEITRLVQLKGALTRKINRRSKNR